VAEKLSGQVFVVLRQAGETGQLYGSVSTRDVADLAVAGGFTIERSQVRLDRPIKAIGLHEVTISLHPEVEVPISVNVAPLGRRGGASGARRRPHNPRCLL
jgi:large subunit ribosomal protein L9